MTKNTSGKHASVASTSSRRAFLKGLGAAGVSVPLAAIAASAASTGKQIPDVLSGPGVLNLNARPGQAFNKRLSAAADDLRLKVPPQPNNGDEVRYKSGIANYTKGFAHDSFGVVVPAVYESYLAAVQTGKRQDFANLPVGGTEPLVDPQAGIAFDLEAYDPSQNSIPPFATLTSTSLAAQMIEVYWQALTRDVPFTDYSTDAMIAAAVSELNGLSAFVGPRIGGSVTPQTVFRGFTAGDLIGPYVSQFFLQPFTLGVMPFVGYMTTQPGDFGIKLTTWLNIQNGRPLRSRVRIRIRR